MTFHNLTRAIIARNLEASERQLMPCAKSAYSIAISLELGEHKQKLAHRFLAHFLN
jgi:hypothetical protein